MLCNIRPLSISNLEWVIELEWFLSPLQKNPSIHLRWFLFSVENNIRILSHFYPQLTESCDGVLYRNSGGPTGHLDHAGRKERPVDECDIVGTFKGYSCGITGWQLYYWYSTRKQAHGNTLLSCRTAVTYVTFQYPINVNPYIIVISLHNCSLAKGCTDREYWHWRMHWQRSDTTAPLWTYIEVSRVLLLDLK